MSIYKRVATHVAGISELKNAINYIFDPEKTCDHLTYSIGVEKKSAYEDMRFLKELYCKTTGRQYLHWVLSHDKDVPLKTVEGVNLEVLELIGNEFQVVAATHTNTQNLHTHFVLNSVKVSDGKKFSQSRRDMLMFRQEVNEVLKSNGLKPIEKIEAFEMSDQVEEVEVLIQNDLKRYKSKNALWTLEEEGLIHPLGREKEPASRIKPFTIEVPKQGLIKPFSLEEGYPTEDIFLQSLRKRMESRKIKPFTFEKEEKS